MIDHVNGTVIVITDAVNNSLPLPGEIAGNIAEVNQSAGEISEESSQINLSAKDLNNLSAQLGKIVGLFKNKSDKK